MNDPATTTYDFKSSYRYWLLFAFFWFAVVGMSAMVTGAQSVVLFVLPLLAVFVCGMIWRDYSRLVSSVVVADGLVTIQYSGRVKTFDMAGMSGLRTRTSFARPWLIRFDYQGGRVDSHFAVMPWDNTRSDAFNALVAELRRRMDAAA